MIELFSADTPNGKKISIMLEEINSKYKVTKVNLLENEQFNPEFRKISPFSKIPVIVDHSNNKEAIFESGAILIYLAEKSNQFLPRNRIKYFDVIQWVMFQMGGIGPMFGQAHHFIHYAPEDIPYAVDRYTKEAGRLYNVLDNRLKDNEYLAGKDYTIADMASFPWALDPGRKCQKPSNFPNVMRWLKNIKARPAVKRGMDVLADQRRDLSKGMDSETRKNLFGEGQYKKH